MSEQNGLHTLQKNRQTISQIGVKTLVLIGHSPDSPPGTALEFLAVLEQPQTYAHLREVQVFLSGLLGRPVDITLADPHDPAVQPYLDPQAVFIL